MESGTGHLHCHDDDDDDDDVDGTFLGKSSPLCFKYTSK